MIRSTVSVLALALVSQPVAAKPAHGSVHGHCRTHVCWKKVSDKRHREFPQHHPERYAYTLAAASWYGPGLYGNSTACGITLHPSTVGVANKTMTCGTKLEICYQQRCGKFTVIDHGPYVGNRQFDLTAPAKGPIGFPRTGTV